jgi:hypothetical protein
MTRWTEAGDRAKATRTLDLCVIGIQMWMKTMNLDEVDRVGGVQDEQ